jgi:aspartokinase/homoserine dehydrogenase 1
MSTLVMKFGGTSVGNAEAMAQAARIVLDAAPGWDRCVVIVSAMSGVTDALARGAQTAAAGDGATFRGIVADLKARHADAVGVLLAPGSPQAELLATIEELLTGFATLCHSVHVLGELTPRALDAITSLGERLSARMLAAYLRQEGARSAAVDATELVVTDDTFQSAMPLPGPSRVQVAERLGPLLQAGVIPIVTGFVGATADGVTTTLGRGGSDYSAALLGDWLDADEVWIWTDVDGVMTADPRLVPDARVIPVLSYSEVGELAYFGAKVLHPRTIRPVIERGIPLWVKNTFNPALPGTRITGQAEAVAGTVKAVTAIHGLSLVTVEGRGMMGVPGIAARTFGAVASQGASVLMISQASSEQSICFVIPTAATPSVIRAIETEMTLELERRDVDRVWAMDGVVIVTAVGTGMRGTPGIAARLFGALGENGINIIAIAQGASECSVSLVVDAADAAAAVRGIHARVIVENERRAAEDV